MANCIDPQGNLHSQDPIPEGWTPCADGDAAYTAALAALQTKGTLAQQQAAAQAKLDRSDVTFLRAQESGQSWSAAWVAYRTALRAVAKSGGTLPALPTTYPDGTPT